MQFFTTIVASLALGSQVLAAPIDVTSTLTTYTGTVTTLSPEEAITLICGAVSGFKIAVTSDLTTISTMSASNVTTFASTSFVPTIKSHLTSIATEMNATAVTLASPVIGLTTPLAASEVAALLNALSVMHTTVTNMQSTLTATTSTFPSDVMTLIKPEIITVMSLFVPLVTPLTAFAYSAVSLLPGGDATLAEIATAASGLNALVSTLLSPVEGILAGLL